MHMWPDTNPTVRPSVPSGIRGDMKLVNDDFCSWLYNRFVVTRLFNYRFPVGFPCSIGF